MATQPNKVLARRVFEEVFNRGNLAAVDEIFATRYVYNNPGSPWVSPNRDGLKQLVSTYRTAFPDIHFAIEDQILEGDKVVIRWTAHGTHKDKFLGNPATGKHVTVMGTTVSRITGGQIVESWSTWDTLGLQQVGILPQLELAGMSRN